VDTIKNNRGTATPTAAAATPTTAVIPRVNTYKQCHFFYIIKAMLCNTAKRTDLLGHTLMQNVTIKQVQNGEYIKRTATAKAVYIKGAYCRFSKAYECTDTQDMSRVIYIKPTKLVIVGFTY